MKKFLLLVSLIFLLFPGFLYSFESGVFKKDYQISIESEYRKLCQGEVVKITLKSPKLSSAKAHFNGKDYMFVNTGNRSTYLLLIGLELNIEPGTHDLNIEIEDNKGKKKDFSFKIPVSERKFSLKKIRVDERFINPPPEARNRILKEVELTRAIYREFTPGWLGDGKFIVPLNGEIKTNFGERRVFNDEFHSRHRGIDIPSPTGIPVRASNSGKVVLTRPLFFSGNTVIINHGLGLFSIYCHLSRIKVEEGNTVGKGEIVGYTGSTGRVTGSHLHWGFRLLESYVDPLSVVYLSFD